MGEKFTRRVVYKGVTVHRWDDRPLTARTLRGTWGAGASITKEYDLVMEKVGELMAAGAAVTLEHRYVNKAYKPGQPYDVIDVEAVFS